MKAKVIMIVIISVLLCSGCEQESGKTTDTKNSVESGIDKGTPPLLDQKKPTQEELDETFTYELKRLPTIEESEAVVIGTPVSAMDGITKADEISVTYTVENVEIGKEIGNHVPVEFYSEEECIDGISTKEGYSFVWVTTRIQNNGSKNPIDFLADVLSVRPGDCSKIDPLEQLWTIGYSTVESEDKANGKGHYTIDPNEEIRLTIGYILPDHMLKDMYYQVGGLHGKAIDPEIETEVNHPVYFLKLF